MRLSSVGVTELLFRNARKWNLTKNERKRRKRSLQRREQRHHARYYDDTIISSHKRAIGIVLKQVNEMQMLQHAKVLNNVCFTVPMI